MRERFDMMERRRTLPGCTVRCLGREIDFKTVVKDFIELPSTSHEHPKY